MAFFVAHECCNLKAGIELQLFQHIMDMAFYGEGRNVESLGDFPVAQALGNEVDNLAFTPRQLYRVIGDGVPGPITRRLMERFHQLTETMGTAIY